MPAAPSNETGLNALADEIHACRKCPRLVAWREQVAVQKRAAYANEDYWGAPVSGFGDPRARIAVVGLAPAAHGANRTGRIFTGDRSGDWLFGALHRAGLANQPHSTAIDDGLRLTDCWVTCPVRCAPPANKPTPEERRSCAPYLDRELALLDRLSVIVVLGAIGYEAMCAQFQISPRPTFGHGVQFATTAMDGRPFTLICSYHVSQQNTFTKRLTEPMLDDVFARAIAAANDQ